MISSTSFSNKPAFLLAVLLIWISVCASANEPPKGENKKSPTNVTIPNIAVLPVSNLSGTPAPLKEIRQSFTTRLAALGIKNVSEKVLETFMAKHRLRNTGGIDRMTARAFKEEIGVDTVLITSLELFSERVPPKIALTSRLVSTGTDPAILWVDGVGLAGDESPGLLGLSLINDPVKLREMAIKELSNSLSGFLSGHPAWAETGAGGKKFRPEDYYRSPVMNEPVKQTIAVTPFLNLSQRKFAGEIMPLHFVRLFRELENFRVIEPGMVRDLMLRERMIMLDGISMADAEVIFNRLDADLVLSGRVMNYEDYEGSTGQPVVDFFALVIDRRSREVVWSSHSYRKGDDGVYFFDIGKIRTAHRLAFQMASSVANMLIR
jgi:TolB-like protein